MMDQSSAAHPKRAPYSSRFGPFGEMVTMMRDPLAVLERLAGEHGPITEFRVGPARALLVAAPDPIHEVLVGNAADFGRARAMVLGLWPALRNGLVVSEGELHHRQRGMIGPLFTPRRMTAYAEAITTQIRVHLDRWSAAGPFDALDSMQRLTHDIMGELFAGEALADDEEALAAITRVFDWEIRLLSRPVVAPLFVPTRRNRTFLRDIAYLRERVGELVEARRSGAATGTDMLQALVEARDADGPMDFEQLVDETINLWASGIETSSDAQFWTAYALSRNPEVAERARAETDRVLGGRPPTAEDLPNLPYCLQVFKEAMRLYSPAPAFLRQAVRDTTVGDYHVRRGTVVFVAPWVMHRSPQWFPRPLVFDPDRFAPDRKLPRHAYLPFGAGKHVCVGSALALLEGQLFTAMLLNSGTLTVLDGDARPHLQTNLRPRGRVHVMYEAREAAQVGDSTAWA
ncbi:cytochrome P450 [Nocardia transvalensis]|uniref:Cytochrome P450 n=1 Tax=Nocardia transvalensis TaxID=37333 RepID=A0A7W9UG45_9NOCA|nr:cytochrome P450 [Nocardia transvalensis]MBB5911884.1 cytochrome P450 [Nocardia transvalensis]